MSYPLAIFSPAVGDGSESFIRRHIQDLLPQGTIAVTGTVDGPFAGHWNVTCPLLVLDRIQQIGLRGQIIRAIARKLGLRHVDEFAIVRRFLQKHQVQVVMGEWLDWSLGWMRIAQELGIRFFGHAHGYDVSTRLRSSKWREEYVQYNRASGVITVSQASRDSLLELGLEPMKVHVVPCGVDVPRQPFRRVEREIIRCVAVGRMVAKKAPILTLDAFRRAVDACPNLRLDYVGADDLFPAAQQFVHAFNLGTKVTLHGGQPNHVVHQLMGAADIFLQHSLTDPVTGDEEGLPVAILEAMANSLPVVSTRHAGIPEAVLEGVTGYLVEEGDSGGMADRIITLARNPYLRWRMGEAGWSRAKAYFSWEKEKAELLSILGLG